MDLRTACWLRKMIPLMCQREGGKQVGSVQAPVATADSTFAYFWQACLGRIHWDKCGRVALNPRIGASGARLGSRETQGEDSPLSDLGSPQDPPAAPRVGPAARAGPPGYPGRTMWARRPGSAYPAGREVRVTGRRPAGRPRPPAGGSVPPLGPGGVRRLWRDLRRGGGRNRRYGCAHALKRGICGNRLSQRVELVEQSLFAALEREALLWPNSLL